MKKKVFQRALLGFPLGIAIGHVIEIIGSLFWGSGHYAPCVPALVESVGSEVYAVMLQALLCGIVGAGFAGASVIWEMEDWPLVKQTGIYFLTSSLLIMPVAYVTHWMEHSVKGFFQYFGIFAVIFLVIWVVDYTVWRHNVKKMNDKLGKTKDRNA